MGYRKIPKIYTLVLDGDLEGLIVRMKGLKLGQMRSLLAIMDDEDSRTLDELPKFLARHIVSWNLEDEQGQPIPADESGLNELEVEEVLILSNKWMDELTGVKEDLGKGSPSGDQFPGQPVTMEAL